MYEGGDVCNTTVTEPLDSILTAWAAVGEGVVLLWKGRRGVWRSEFGVRSRVTVFTHARGGKLFRNGIYAPGPLFGKLLVIWCRR